MHSPTPNSSLWNRRIMPITFRLSIVAALVGAMVFAGDYYLARHRLAQKIVGETLRIDRALECASHYSDEALKQHANTYGLFDISKVGCADKAFLASIEEVRNAKARAESEAKRDAQYWEEFFRYTSWHSGLEVGLFGGIAAFIAVNVLGYLLIGLRSVLSWVVRGNSV